MSETLDRFEQRRFGLTLVNGYIQILLHNWPPSEQIEEILVGGGKDAVAEVFWSDGMLREAVTAGLACVVNAFHNKQPKADADSLEKSIRLGLCAFREDDNPTFDAYLAEWRKPYTKTPYGLGNGIGKAVFDRLGVDATMSLPGGGRCDDYLSFTLVMNPILKSAIDFVSIVNKELGVDTESETPPMEVDPVSNPTARRPTQASKPISTTPAGDKPSSVFGSRESQSGDNNFLALISMAIAFLLGPLMWLVVAAFTGLFQTTGTSSSDSSSRETNRYAGSEPVLDWNEVRDEMERNRSRQQASGQNTTNSTVKQPWLLPLTGHGEIFTRLPAVAPLTITAAPGSNHYYCKLVEAYTNVPVAAVFVRAGETASIKVPLGRCELKYATGRNWYGPADLFGKETSFNKADDQFNFEQIGNSIAGFRVELKATYNGNLETYPISRDQW